MHDELLVLASDGVWDVIPNEYMCDVARKIQAGLDVRAACDAVLTEALSRGSRDNMSIVMVSFQL